MSKPIQGRDNFKRALQKLREFIQTPATTERERAGIVQAFKFTFEQCWKAFQKRAELEGISCPSPKRALQTALQLGWMDPQDEKIWLSMLEDRNLTSHLYREEVALAVCERILKDYVGLFEKAAVVLEREK